VIVKIRFSLCEEDIMELFETGLDEAVHFMVVEVKIIILLNSHKQFLRASLSLSFLLKFVVVFKISVKTNMRHSNSKCQKEHKRITFQKSISPHSDMFHDFYW